jgi:hypothetical protein
MEEMWDVCEWVSECCSCNVDECNDTSVKFMGEKERRQIWTRTQPKVSAVKRKRLSDQDQELRPFWIAKSNRRFFGFEKETEWDRKRERERERVLFRKLSKQAERYDDAKYVSMYRDLKFQNSQVFTYVFIVWCSLSLWLVGICTENVLYHGSWVIVLWDERREREQESVHSTHTPHHIWTWVRSCELWAR